MTRNPFGWDLPPGVTQRHIDEAAGGYDEPPAPPWVTCGKCEGHGTIGAGYNERDCPMCNGKGGWAEEARRRQDA